MAEPSPARRRQVAGRRGNLPAEVSGFIGRRNELRQLVALQRAHRLLTLVGPGGVGKTRLAVRLAALRARAYADGSWIVDLAPLADPDLIAPAIVATLGLPRMEQPTAEAVLVDYLRERRMLLVLDTCEHHVTACSRLASTLLQACPGIDIVATSRQPLAAANELVWRVPPLSVPRAHVSRLRLLRQSEAGQLFVARARAALPDLDLADKGAEVAARICRVLDGSPLAVELVAAHVARLGMNDLAARINGPLVLGLEGARGAAPRHRTLRACLDWSYELLSDSEQRLARRLAVFADGCTTDAARTVCAERELSADSISDLLASLVDKSMLSISTAGQHRRYRLSNVARQCGLESLRARDELEFFQRRHLLWMLSVAEQAAPEMLDVQLGGRLAQEESNLRAALEFAVSAKEVETGLRIVTAAIPYWYFHDHYAEATAWLDRLLALASSPVSQKVSAAARAFRAQLLVLQGEYLAAEADLQRLVDEERLRGDTAGLARALLMLGNAAMWRGRFEAAKRAYAAALDLQDVPNSVSQLISYQCARIAWESGDLTDARAFADRVVDLGGTRSVSITFGRAKQIRALLAAEEGAVNAALDLLSEAEIHQRRIQDQNGLIDTLQDRGEVLLAANRHEQARSVLAQALRVADAIAAHPRLLRVLEGLSRVLVSTDPAQAVQLASAAAASRLAAHSQLWPRDRRLLNESLDIARTRLGEPAYARAWQSGSVILEPEAVTLALSAASAQLVRESPRKPANVTPREWEVVRLLAEGAANSQIADRLVISPATVRTHLDRIQAKLGLHSRVQLAAWAVQSASLRDE